MATVLVTGAGSPAGIGAIRTLDKTPHRTVGVDVDAQAPGIHLADEGCSIPSASDDGWTDRLAAIARECSVDAVVPTGDAELRRLSRLSKALPAEAAIVAPDQELIDAALDRYDLSTRLAGAGHPVPTFRPATAAGDLPQSAYPVVIEPRRGPPRREGVQIDSPGALSSLLDATDRPAESLLVRSVVSGTEFATSVVARRDGRLLGIVPKEVLERDGATARSVTRLAPAVTESCRRLFETLEPTGPVTVRQVVDGNGVPHTIGIEPRVSATAPLTAAAGVNELDLLVRDALGEDVTHTGGYEAGLHLFAYPDQVVVPKGDLAESETVDARLESDASETVGSPSDAEGRERTTDAERLEPS